MPSGAAPCDGLFSARGRHPAIGVGRDDGRLAHPADNPVGAVPDRRSGPGRRPDAVSTTSPVHGLGAEEYVIGDLVIVLPARSCRSVEMDGPLLLHGIRVSSGFSG